MRRAAVFAVALGASAVAGAAEPESNILPGDYVGPEACRKCHPANYKLWHAGSHRTMNQPAIVAAVKAPFRGERVAYQGGEVVFDRSSGGFTMTLRRGGRLVRRYVATKTVGSRFMQFYIGRQVEGPEPLDHAIYQEHKLPFGYFFKHRRWLPQSYFDPSKPDWKEDGSPSRDIFAEPDDHPYAPNCMICHNTYAYLYRVQLPDRLRAGLPKEDLMLRADEVWRETQKTMPVKAVVARDKRTYEVIDNLTPDRLSTLGISCEACHYGGRQHAKGAKIRFLPTSPLLTVMPQDSRKSAQPIRQNAYAVNGICAQCHTALVGEFPNGAGSVNSRESRDMAAGGCQTEMKCTDCHNPHVGGLPEAAPDGPGYLAPCLRCHSGYGGEAGSSRHVGHDERVKINCLDCHMPRVSQGLEDMVRTHTITSPNDPKMLAAGSYNACNLCHLDKSIRWTAEWLSRLWKKKVEPDESWAERYGSLDAAVGPEWLGGKNPVMRMVAAQAYSRSPLGRSMLPGIVGVMDDPVAVNRLFGQLAVERVLRRRLTVREFDVTAPPGQRRRQKAALLAKPGRRPNP